MSTMLLANDREKSSDAKAIIRNSGKSAVYQLVYLSEVPGTVNVSIVDAKGNTIMTDRVKNVEEGFMRPYNFSALAEGNYLIEIQDAKGKVMVPFIHKVSKTVQPLNVKVKALPTDKKFQVIMIGNQSDVLQVNILDEAKALVYTDYIDATNSFSKVYDLTKVKANNFTFEIRNSNEIISTQQF
ncbi:hypothetical protein GXP67_22385 [Rhodocytophaga rosea]|uniref:T9SS type A sorting domain-containing protein n=1 Tax=Rhodocytophaga rosea TaxID=2704465 RepID=A0A6C0GNI9_9BACT|nr:hypothetical protein [Rhodocytophaga rosea]QHT69193.1 hypothetical protein GXP67_22385 [Rhodocytophaga rosea]